MESVGWHVEPSRIQILTNYHSGALAAKGWLGPENREGFSSQNELLQTWKA